MVGEKFFKPIFSWSIGWYWKSCVLSRVLPSNCQCKYDGWQWNGLEPSHTWKKSGWPDIAFINPGEKFNWNILHENNINKPFFLSGGIGLKDVEKLKTFKHPFFYCVDVNSKVEISEGVKDMGVVKELADELLTN